METAKSLGVRLARALYGRWRTLGPASQKRLEPLAEETKSKALELRGAADGPAAERDLQAANETFAAALLEDAEADPDVDAAEVSRLRDDLRRELERLASAEIKASRGDAQEQRADSQA
jgi:hypothetical protein